MVVWIFVYHGMMLGRDFKYKSSYNVAVHWDQRGYQRQNFLVANDEELKCLWPIPLYLAVWDICVSLHTLHFSSLWFYIAAHQGSAKVFSG